ncbi:MAG: chemotaxis response regulator protein-glutamate methylesterase [Candidatus Omnitrophica bacterium]|nr:chemotaxis response regulator protein-glutamate methylesterase [Candidatus Omnitrophota bacterium]
MIRIVIADDSTLLRRMLKELIEEDGQLQVVGAAQHGLEAIALVKQLQPDILILDCEMPVMNGLEALRKIMAECPLPVFMFSSLTWEGASVTIKALEWGAVDFLLKPAREVNLKEVAQELIKKIKFIVLRSKFQKLSRRTQAGAAAAAPRPAAPAEAVKTRRVEIVAMGSSTGGVQATMKVVPLLPPQTPPVVWVQHMPPGFTKSFADRLAGVSRMRVKEAADGDLLETGICYLAPGGVQMRLHKAGARLMLRIAGQEKVSGHCPSCDVLFESVAQYFSETVLGVILTGMGEDGAAGLRRLHEQGAYVIGQNEESCVVYGMPKAARDAGAVDIEVDISEVAKTIMKIGGLA